VTFAGVSVMMPCMGNARGVKRDFDALEKRRLRAHELLKQGLTEAEVARRIGVHRQSVNRWNKEIEKHGRAGLKKAGRAGRKSRLSEADFKRIERELKRGPEALGYETGLWTLDRVAKLIEQHCGIKYHPGHVWWLLGKLGWSCQRPTGRALQRDEAIIERWKKTRWPKLKKKPSGSAAP
jgi:transposase